MASRFTRIYDFLTGKWHIPLSPDHYYDLLVLLGSVGLTIFLSVYQAGMSAGALPIAARIFAVLLSLHIFALARRGKHGIGFRTEAFAFLPTVLWLLFDWVFFAEKPWLAEINFISAITAFGVFWITLYHLRHFWLKWIVCGFVLLAGCLLASLAWGDQQGVVSTFLGRTISPGYAGMFCGLPGNPAAAGAILLLTFFPACAILLARSRMLWQRLLAAYAAVVLLIGIYMTHHVGVWIGCLVGTVILATLILGRFFSKFLLIVLTVGVFALFSPKMKTNVGVFYSPPATSPAEHAGGGSIETEAPLAHIALDAVKTAPLQGLGSGGFEIFFEKNRPAGWRVTAMTPGSLPLAVLAESGIIGFLLLFVPACWLWVAGLVACLRLPTWELSGRFAKHIERHTKVKKGYRIFNPERIVPAQRILFGGILAGTAGAAILLCVDYPGAMPAVMCFFALNGAILLREIARAPFVFKTTGALKYLFGAGIVLKPAIWVLWVLAPVTAASLAEKAAETVSAFLPTPENPAAGYRLDANATLLTGAADDAREALQLNPQNADALNILAKSSLCLSAFYPQKSDAFGAEALAAARRACEISPNNPDFLLVYGAALSMHGDDAGALEKFREALKIAPRNLPALLTVGDYFYARKSTLNAETLAIFNEIIKLYPKNEYAQRRQKLLTEVGTADEGETGK